MSFILRICHWTEFLAVTVRLILTMKWKKNTPEPNTVEYWAGIKRQTVKENLNKLQTSGLPHRSVFNSTPHGLYKIPQIHKETRHLPNKQSGISSLWIRSFAGNHVWFPSIIILTNHLAGELIEIVICVTPHQTTIDAPKCLDRHVTPIQPIRLFFFC